MTDQPPQGQLEPIPQPPGRPFVGNLMDIDAGAPVQDLKRLAKDYGPIFKLGGLGKEAVFVSGFSLVDEVCDQKRFDKKLGAGLVQVRSFAGDGLFTAYTREPNWRLAHRILLPAFSSRAIQGYLPMMLDVAGQLMKKWERLNPGDEIDVTADTTRLALETVGLCGFGYRFNSFYREEPHPFVQAMTRCLATSQERARQPALRQSLDVRQRRQFDADVELMTSTVDRIIKYRREHPDASPGKRDLLSYMLDGKDRETGESLDDVNIRYQIITFLIAGHETTSGLLSFSLYLLMHHPEVLARAYAEVDEVLGTDPTVQPAILQVLRLKYISQVLKEALRLWPPAAAFSVAPLEEETVIGGKYRITREQGLTVLTASLHRDPSVWGADPEAFDPDHFSPEAEASRPENAYKPFGNGQRSCIGREFAMQEATLALGLTLQRFELIDHTNYQLKIHETLTEKPDGFKMRVKRRTAAGRGAVGAAGAAGAAGPA
jgi:cytochrome P450/NADPH-cytochrome P450 reductase